MFKSFKYRLEPNVNQARELNATLETHRRLYNSCLEQRQNTYKDEKRSVTYYDQSTWFKNERTNNTWLARINFSSGQATMRILDRAFRDFFKRVTLGKKPGYPRFKAASRFNSISFPAMGDGISLRGNKIRLQGIGKVRINLHRPVEGLPKTATLKRKAAKWYVVFSCDMGPPVEISANTDSVGIDLGIECFLAKSNGEFEPRLQPLKNNLAELRRKQRAVSRAKRFSKGRVKACREVSNLHLSVANYRRDKHHKIARSLVNEFGLIAVEVLNIRGMIRSRWFSRAIQDAAWGQFLMILKHKAESAGVRVIEVNARGTSQTCPQCGHVRKKELSQRCHSCKECEYSTHRDHAAAQVILARALAGAQPGGPNTGAVDSVWSQKPSPKG